MDIYTESRILTEEPVGGMLRKQQSITRLFPSFYDRVDDVARAGGLSLYKEKPGLWHFKVNSATEAGKMYDIYIEFADMVEQINNKVRDRRLWKADGSGVDLRKLAAAIVEDADVKILCSCPAFQYWGPAYITTRRGSKYGDKETRPPRKRNPKEYGIACKHSQLMFDVLPFYKGTMAGHLKRFYSNTIKAAEEKAKKEVGAIKRGAKFLAKKEAEPKKAVEPEKGAIGTEPKESVNEHDPKDMAKQIQDLIDVQVSDPATKKEDYMKGLGNGLVVAKAVVDGQEPNWVTDDEKERYFVERTNKHIDLVKEAARIISQTGIVDGAELMNQVEVHDQSKFHPPEREPYIELTWNKRKGIKETNPRINAATLAHVTSNQHHPEYWLEDKSEANIKAEDRDKSDKVVDASRMPPLAIAEMVADWQGMSEELKTNSAREWFDKQRDVRWHFSDEQVELIDRLLKVFEGVNNE